MSLSISAYMCAFLPYGLCTKSCRVGGILTIPGERRARNLFSRFRVSGQRVTCLPATERQVSTLGLGHHTEVGTVE